MNPLLTKVPWKTVCRVVGYALVGTASVLSAAATDEKTQTMIKTLANKSATVLKKQES